MVDDVVGAHRLHQTSVKDEVAACDDDRSMNNIVILDKVLINELSLALTSQALDALNGHGINIDKIYVTLTRAKADTLALKTSSRTQNLRMSVAFTCGSEWSLPAWFPI